MNATSRRNLLAPAGFVVLCFGAGAIGRFFSPGEWFQQLERPPLNPPGWVFGPTWAFLYLCMAASAWLAWKSNHPLRKTALGLFAVQLALNALWSPVFFGLEQPLPALVVIVLLWFAILAFLRVQFRIDRLAGWLLVPYLAWVSFATYLNAGFWWLNRQGLASLAVIGNWEFGIGSRL